MVLTKKSLVLLFCKLRRANYWCAFGILSKNALARYIYPAKKFEKILLAPHLLVPSY